MKPRLPKSFLRSSLKHWVKAQHYRYGRYRYYRARSLPLRSKKWLELAHKADKKVKLRRRQLAAWDAYKSPRQKAVANAIHYAKIGVKENPAGSNSGPFISEWQKATARGGTWLQRTPWCGTFCENMAREQGVKTSSRWASVWFISQDAKAHTNGFRGWTQGTKGVRPGDLCTLFGFAHVEMVERIAPEGVYTIGGNTSSGNAGSQSNGGGVYRRLRAYSAIDGFALVDYPS